jgi:antitoxin PrlF
VDFASLSGAGFSLEAAMPAKVTKDGRVTIPKWVREHLDIRPSAEVAFRRADDGSIVIERAKGVRPPSRFAKLVGITGSGPSTDEIRKVTRGEDR